jgi:hypothetical protein
VLTINIGIDPLQTVVIGYRHFSFDPPLFSAGTNEMDRAHLIN